MPLLNEIPSPPEWFTHDQARAFEALAQELFDRNVLTDGDIPVLEVAAMSLGLAIAANRDIQERGQLVEQQRGGYRGAAPRVELVKNPSVSIMHEALADFHKAAAQLGIGVNARARLASMGVSAKAKPQAVPGIDEIAAARSDG